MRRTIAALALGWGAGLCMAAGAAYGYALLDAWRAYGENFQLGYVVGYLDAAQLAARHDKRAAVMVGTSGPPQYERWRALVNDFFADPANAKRSVPDGMEAAANVFRAEFGKAFNERLRATQPRPTPGAPGAAAPTTTPR